MKNKSKIPTWIYASGILIAFMLLSLTAIAFIWGQSSVCIPCTGWEQVNPVCIIQYETCKLFHDIGYFLLIGGAAFISLCIVLLGVGVLFKDEVNFTKLFAWVFLFVLALTFLVLMGVDLLANVLSMVPILGPILETVGESFLEVAKAVILVMSSILSYVLGASYKNGLIKK